MSTTLGTTPLALSSVTEALKEHYKPLRVKNMVYKNNPLLAMMPKYESFGGENMPVPIVYANNARRSAAFAKAQGNDSTSKVGQFLLTRVKDYAFATVNGEAIKATQSNTDAFLRLLTLEVDGALNALTRSLAVAMYRDGGGSVGQVGSVSTDVVTLSNSEDVTNFEVGMEVRFGTTKTGSVRVGVTGITAVDRSAGTITVTASDITGGPTANDYIFQEGDEQDGATNPLRISGLEAWCPETAPGATTFFGQDRSVDTTRLGGNRFDGSALPIEEALIEGASLVAREGGSPDYVFVDFATYTKLEKALSSKIQYTTATARDVDIGFSGIKINGPRGMMTVLPDQNCQPDVAWMVQMDTWCLNSLGAAPHFLDYDGTRMLREIDADAYETRLGFYGNIGCNAPGWNCRIKLA